MTDVNFETLLDADYGSLKPPPQLPVGSYIFGITKFEFDKTKGRPAQNGEAAKPPTELVRFTVKPMQALDDVDQDELGAYQSEKALSDTEMRLEFYLTPAAAYRVQDFLRDHAKVDGAANLREAIQLAPGQQFMGMVSQRPNPRNPERPYIDISQTMAVPE